MAEPAGLPGYFAALGIPLRTGRWLTEADEAPGRILINETLARRSFPNQDPIATHLVLGVMDTVRNCRLVGDVREFGLDRETEPTFYSLGAGPTVTLIVKPASLDPAGIAFALAIVARSLDTGACRPRSRPPNGACRQRRY